LLVCQPAFAAENWPDSVDQYVAQVRKTLVTTDMEGYLSAVKNPNGALLLMYAGKTSSRPDTHPGRLISPVVFWSSEFGNCWATRRASIWTERFTSNARPVDEPP
jgi:hypothetical protein